MAHAYDHPLIASDPADGTSRERLVTELGVFFNKIGIAADFMRLCREEMRRSGTVSKKALQRITSELEGAAGHGQAT